MRGPNLGILTHRFDVDLAIDVGAHVGRFGQRLLRAGYDRHLISVEPNSHIFEELEKKTRSHDNWSAKQIALGRCSGSAQLFVSNETSFSSLHPANSKAFELFGDMPQVTRVEDVKVLTLEELLNQFSLSSRKPKSILLKSDTQGNELDVIRSAGSWLEKISVAMLEVSIIPIYENSILFSDVDAELTRYGFNLHNLFPVSWSENGAVVEFDAIYINSKSETTSRQY